MSGIEKITEKILSDANEQRERIINEANKKAEELIEGVKAEVQEGYNSIIADANRKAEDADKVSSSSGELTYRRLVLAAKTDILQDILKASVKALNELPSSEYFEVLSEMAISHAHEGKEGLIRFNKADKNRLPADFLQKVNARLGSKSSLTIDDMTADIDGGFLLIYGNIEENCDFNAIVSSKANKLSDIAADMLFFKD
ncbi:MAG TPA: V-type ATP synthase subunit E family protein [Clostridia bacterium]|nr:V-type ATP synthase subunit E family protein [Clostridia bacterium]